MKGQQIGYVRVSTIDQNTARQLDGLALDRCFTDTCSGASRNRPALKQCVDYLREGDTLHVHAIDRLARDLKDLQTLVGELTEQGVSVHFAKENITFAGTQEGLPPSPMDTLMLQLIGAVAEFERAMIRERQREGIRAAQKAGKRIGAPPKLNAAQKAEIRTMKAEGRSISSIARHFSVSRTTIYGTLAEK